MKRTTLTRDEYAEQTAAIVRPILTPDEFDSHVRKQYPKDAQFATAELRFRGADVEALPADRAFDAAALDGIVDTAELCNWLTPEAAAAREAGVGLVEFRGGVSIPRQV